MVRWYDLTPEEAAAQLNSDLAAGLSASEAKRRQKKNGFNHIYPIPEGNLAAYLKQISLNPLSIMLLLTALLTGLFTSLTTSIAILLLLAIGYASAIFIYNKAQQIFAGMSKFSLPYAKVLRNGHLYILRQEQLVAGDIIFLSEGDIVPADARLIDSDKLYLIESGITAASGAVHKHASFYDFRNLAPHQQVNMVFASTIVAKGRGKAIVCRVGKQTLVAMTDNNRPAVRYDHLTLFERLQKVSYYLSLLSISVVFLFTVLNLLTHRWEVLTGFSILLALSAATLSEFYTAFARVLVASGIFSSMQRKDKLTKGALIKNADKLRSLADVTTLLIPPECLVNERDMQLSAIMAGGTFYDFNATPEDALSEKLLRFAVLSTGIYGTSRMMELNQAGEATFSFEENAILNAGNRSGIWNRALDEEYSLIEHRRRADAPSDAPDCDLTLTHHAGQYILIARGDVKQILDLCSHYTDPTGRPRSMTVVRRQMILTDAGQLMRGSRQITAIATTLTSAQQISSVGELAGQFTFEGLLAFDQPLLPGCAKTVQKLKDAGMRLILVCPEVSQRYYYLAESLGIITDPSNSVTADEIAAMGEEAFMENFPEFTLYQGLSISKRRAILKLWRDKGETVLYMGRELSETTMIREADVGATQALTLSGRGYQSFSSLNGEKLSVSFSQSSDGSLNGCDALRFVADVVVSMVDGEGAGGLNALSTALCTAKSVFRNLRRMFTYLTASLTARVLLTLMGFLFGSVWLSTTQLLFWGLIVDLSAILILALAAPDEELPGKTALRSVSVNSTDYFKRLFYLSASLGGSLAISQLITVLLSLIWKTTVAQQSTLVFLSALPAMAILLWETGRHTHRKHRSLSFSRISILLGVAMATLIVLAFLIPPLGTALGIAKMNWVPSLLVLLPGVLLLAACEVLHRLLGDL